MPAFDVAVIGAGVHGLAVANALCDTGRRVVVLDKGTARSPRASCGPARIIRCSPNEGANYEKLMALAMPGWLAWQDLSSNKLIDWNGALLAGPPDSEFVASATDASKRHHASFERLTAKGIDERFDGFVRLPDDWLGVLQHDAGVVRAGALLEFLRNRLVREGGRIINNCDVKGFNDGQQPMIHDPTIRVGHVGHVIACVGPWFSSLFPDAPAPEIQVKWVAVADPMPGCSLSEMPPVILDDAVELFATLQDSRLRVGSHRCGASVEAPDAAPGTPFDLVSAARFFPGWTLMSVDWERCWYTITPSGSFEFKSHGATRRILSVQCCNGHGFKYSPAVASIARDWVERNDNVWLAEV